MTDYPYTNARIAARKAKLLDRSDYDRMRKMGVNEISRFLQEKGFDQINEIGDRYSGGQLIERAVNRELAQEFNELISIAGDNAKPLIKAYLRRYDVKNLKRLRRWKENDEKDEIEALLFDVGALDLEKLRDASIEELGNFSFPDSDVDYSSLVDEHGFEEGLDRGYAREIMNAAEDSGNKTVEAFISRELLHGDVMRALRTLKAGGNPGEAVYNATGRDLSSLEDSRSFEEGLEAAQSLTGVEAETLTGLEKGLESRLLEEAASLLHRDPLGISSSIGYIVAKEAEADNIRKIARSKERGLMDSLDLDELVVV